MYISYSITYNNMDVLLILNVCIPTLIFLTGNYSFSAAASEMLHTVIMEAAKTVDINCSLCLRQCDTNNKTIYDDWVSILPNPHQQSIPR